MTERKLRLVWQIGSWGQCNKTEPSVSDRMEPEVHVTERNLRPDSQQNADERDSVMGLNLE